MERGKAQSQQMYALYNYSLLMFDWPNSMKLLKQWLHIEHTTFITVTCSLHRQRIKTSRVCMLCTCAPRKVLEYSNHWGL
jgi:hypothetical protein